MRNSRVFGRDEARGAAFVSEAEAVDDEVSVLVNVPEEVSVAVAVFPLDTVDEEVALEAVYVLT